jgi:Raf kinase inhibitor-like YbhB/YbcL family protein
MDGRPFSPAITVVVFGMITACAGSPGGSASPASLPSSGIRLRSSGFEDGAPIPRTFTCDGSNVSPPLAWTGGPLAAEYALIVTDPDAPDGEFVHWVIYGIRGTRSGLAEGEVPEEAKQGKNSFGKVGYDGPCPPGGDQPHRYVFTLYGMKSSATSKLAPGASAQQVLDAATKAGAATGTLIGTYHR